MPRIDVIPSYFSDLVLLLKCPSKFAIAVDFGKFELLYVCVLPTDQVDIGRPSNGKDKRKRPHLPRNAEKLGPPQVPCDPNIRGRLSFPRPEVFVRSINR